MNTAQEFLNQVNVIVSKINETENTITKAELIQYQKEIKLIKKSVIESKRVSNAEHEISKTNTSPGCLSVFMGKKAMISSVASQKRRIQNKKLVISNQYDQVLRFIDSYLAQIDKMKGTK